MGEEERMAEIKVRYPKSFKDTIFYRFPTMTLKDTLIFVGVCIAAGFVFSGIIEIAFGIVSIIMVAHFVVYTVVSRYYQALEQARKEPVEKVIHKVEGENNGRRT